MWWWFRLTATHSKITPGLSNSRDPKRQGRRPHCNQPARIRYTLLCLSACPILPPTKEVLPFTRILHTGYAILYLHFRKKAAPALPPPPHPHPLTSVQGKIKHTVPKSRAFFSRHLSEHGTKFASRKSHCQPQQALHILAGNGGASPTALVQQGLARKHLHL